jgi:hypothetical protein
VRRSRKNCKKLLALKSRCCLSILKRIIFIIRPLLRVIAALANQSQQSGAGVSRQKPFDFFVAWDKEVQEN